MKASVLKKLDELALSLSAGLWGKDEAWGGAGASIVSIQPHEREDRFYPDDQYLVTNYVNELSWLFIQLRDIANKVDGYGMWKEEFFQRLVSAGNKATEHIQLKFLMFHILREAYESLDMIEAGMTIPDYSDVVFHPRTVGSDIEGFDPESLQQFFDLRGISIQ